MTTSILRQQMKNHAIITSVFVTTHIGNTNSQSEGWLLYRSSFYQSSYPTDIYWQLWTLRFWVINEGWPQSWFGKPCFLKIQKWYVDRSLIKSHFIISQYKSRFEFLCLSCYVLHWPKQLQQYVALSQELFVTLIYWTGLKHDRNSWLVNEYLCCIWLMWCRSIWIYKTINKLEKSGLYTVT